MNVKELVDGLNLTVFHMEEPEREVSGGYAGDLLSWVMGYAPENCAWLTIMSNQNVAAVALMVDITCVILTEGVTPDDALLAKAKAQGVNLFGCAEPTFDSALRLGALFS